MRARGKIKGATMRPRYIFCCSYASKKALQASSKA